MYGRHGSRETLYQCTPRTVYRCVIICTNREYSRASMVFHLLREAFFVGVGMVAGGFDCSIRRRNRK